MKQSDIINGLMLSIGKLRYSLPELEYLCRPFGIASGNIRTYISRSVKKGNFIVERKGRTAFYSHGGQISLAAAAAAQSFQPPDWRDWDGSWWGVSFSFPDEEKPKRHTVRKSLSVLRFAPLNPGFWIRPRGSGDDKPFPVSLKTDPGCRLMKLYPDEPISGQDAERMWGLSRVNSDFRSAIDIVESVSGGMEKMKPSDALKKRIELGCRVIPILTNDPLLPESLLPDGWLGGELRQKFFNCDRILKNQAEPYWSRVII